jgi:hypothetical protein
MKESLPLTLSIELPDDQVAAPKAEAEGLSLAEWIQQLAEQPATVHQPHRHIAEVICENMQDVPPELMATMHEDGVVSTITTFTLAQKRGMTALFAEYFLLYCLAHFRRVLRRGAFSSE